MGNDDNGIFEIHQIVFQPAHGFDVEVIGRLVEKKDVGVSEKRLRQQYADLLFRVELAHGGIMKFLRNLQGVEELSRLIFGVIAVHFRKFAFEFGGTDSVLFRKVRIGIQGVLFVHDVHEVFIAEHDGAEHRLFIVHILVLLQNGHTLVFIQRDISLLRFYFARKDFKKSRFSRAVGAYDAVTIPFREFKVDVLKQFFAAVLKAYARNL